MRMTARQPFWIIALFLSVVAMAGCAASDPHLQPEQRLLPPRQVVPTAPAGPGGDIGAENARGGDPGWRITHPNGAAIAGYTDRADAVPGAPVRLFVSTVARSFRVRAFRFGWYGGVLARLVWSSPALPGRRQPAAVLHPHGMVVAPWRPSLTLPTAGWPPGSYLLRLDAAAGAQQYVPLVIRSPSMAGRVVMLQAVTSFQAYNGWGGYDLYNGRPDGSFANRARVVSFDRPYQSAHGAGSFFDEEQPLVSFAERLGLPLGYGTSVDLDLDPHLLDGAVAVISEAHDEYWSPGMRATLMHARDRGVNIAFFGANAIYRKIRFEASALGPDRIEVNYKDPLEDPLYGMHNALVTGNWPDPPHADPESSLIGQAYGCFSATAPMVVTNPRSWVWAGSGARSGTKLAGLVGVEFDEVNLSFPTPRPIEILARSPENCYGQPVTSNVTYYVARGGAGVFDAGTEGWICALPSVTGCPDQPVGRLARRVIGAATRNVLQAFARGPAGRDHPAHDFLTGQLSS